MSQALKAWKIKTSNVWRPERFLPLGKDCPVSLHLVLSYLPLTVAYQPTVDCLFLPIIKNMWRASEDAFTC